MLDFKLCTDEPTIDLYEVRIMPSKIHAKYAVEKWLENHDEPTGDTLIEVSIAALTTESELRDIGRSLIALVRYHASKVEPPVDSVE